ncbi:DUF192 domain-containing protein [Natronogracilivirga saccharolytica]|uniref:DUF192 domain-containing protein n=1 Tax=Natronogracilivirga saccharolytica TaxID=2812953 RepID=A0A8J7RNT2_9BACT|nr:DUF192 domain-containing protein [Natronogracilivirga saccharolytica]MBP3193159.1 DUF192 domain-containing protein [Natronogracilivirga saccharolytica]
MKIFRCSALLILLPFLISCGNDDSPERIRDTESNGRTIDPTHTVEILTEDRQETVAEVNVALAQTENERNRGLMEVQEMDFDTGMYFIFEDERERSFWMVNTPLSLDIIYMDSNDRIVRIHTNTTPYSDRQIPSESPAQYVLEVNAGFVREYDIREGMHVVLNQ